MLILCSLFSLALFVLEALCGFANGISSPLCALLSLSLCVSQNQSHEVIMGMLRFVELSLSLSFFLCLFFRFNSILQSTISLCYCNIALLNLTLSLYIARLAPQYTYIYCCSHLFLSLSLVVAIKTDDTRESERNKSAAIMKANCYISVLFAVVAVHYNENNRIACRHHSSSLCVGHHIQMCVCAN
jgi:hypothetical protein